MVKNVNWPSCNMPDIHVRL